MKPKVCPKCGGRIFAVEYTYSSSFHYDGTSEFACQHALEKDSTGARTCDYRIGRFCGEALGDKEEEPPYCKGGTHTGAVHTGETIATSKGASDGMAGQELAEVEVAEGEENPEGEPATPVETEPVESEPAQEKEEEKASEGEKSEQESEAKSPPPSEGKAGKKESFWEWLKRMFRKLLEQLKKFSMWLNRQFKKGRNLVRKLFGRKFGSI